jgi:predicted nucleotidyltransferase
MVILFAQAAFLGGENIKVYKMHPQLNDLTAYPDVNEILNLLLSRVKEILGDQVIGMYLFGSLANGGFDQHSDIDVLVVTKAEISEDAFSALKEMHKQINKIDSPWAIQLEVSYIPQKALRRFDPANILHPHMDRGNDETLHRMSHANDWIIQRHILRERGVIITGPDLKILIDPVSQDDLRKAVADVLPLWANPILDDPSQIDKRGYQSYCVLSLCRMLYTLKYGEIVSKHFAAEWAKENWSHWTGLIERAWLGRQSPNLEAQPKDIYGTLELMRYTLEYSKQIEKERFTFAH